MNNTLDHVIAHAKSPLKDTRVVEAIKTGQWARQGDVYIVAIDPAEVENWKPTDNRQLAHGETAGSRHTVDSSVTVLANPGGYTTQVISRGVARLLGPQIQAKDRFTVSHPEHADISLPAGNYQVCFQCDPQTQKRVQD